MAISLIYHLYKVTSSNAFRKLRGSWRIREIIKKYIFGKDRYIRTPYLGHSIYVCASHSMGKKIFEGGVYEPAIIKTIQTFVDNNFSFIDIGANIGLHTLAGAFARRNNDQVFISFEPQHDIFSILKKNCLANKLNFVKCRQEGVSETDTFLKLNESLTNNKGRSSFLPRENTKPGQQVKVSTLDTLFLGNEYLTAKDILIKIDTEGYELPIIKGGVRWLSKVKNLVIICEVSPDLMERNTMAEGDLFTTLKECGFRKYKVYSDKETVTDLGISNDQYNIVFYKGMLSEKVFSLIETEI